MRFDLHDSISKNILQVCKTKYKGGPWNWYNLIDIRIEQCMLIKANDNIFALQKSLSSTKCYKKFLITLLSKID